MKPKKHIHNIILSALFTAIIALLSQISIQSPFGVPITLQTFAVAFCGYFLGAKWSMLSVIAYIFTGAVGIPVFSQFKGGLSSLFGLSGGYIIGFLFLSLFCGFCRKNPNTLKNITLSASGLMLCHLIGILWLLIVSKGDILSSFAIGSLFFVLKDIISLILAYISSKIIIKRIPKFSDFN
ncbi:MAG: biotin transporter BioY [Clostridia bacterium]|nr:biotin transporter BioY [Clostridia bacterium]